MCHGRRGGVHSGVSGELDAVSDPPGLRIAAESEGTDSEGMAEETEVSAASPPARGRPGLPGLGVAESAWLREREGTQPDCSPKNSTCAPLAPTPCAPGIAYLLIGVGRRIRAVATAKLRQRSPPSSKKVELRTHPRFFRDITRPVERALQIVTVTVQLRRS